MLTFADLRRREFSRLDTAHHTYADYTGSALYGSSQILDHYALMARGIFGNPHAEARASRASNQLKAIPARPPPNCESMSRRERSDACCMVPDA